MMTCSTTKKKCYKGIYFEVYDKEKAVYETS